MKFIKLLIIGVAVVMCGSVFSALKGCSADEEEYEKFGKLKWPDSKLANMLPKPESTKGRVDTDNEEELDVYVGDTTQEQFEEYVDLCKERGFTKDYDSGSYSFGEAYYEAKNSEGYSLDIDYYPKDGVLYSNTMEIELTKPENKTKKKAKKTTQPTKAKKQKETTAPKPTEKPTEKPTKATQPADNNTVGGVNKDFKASMDKYEEFFNEYVEFMKKYNENPADLRMLADYANLMVKYEKYMNELDKIDDDKLSDADLVYYNEVHARIIKKLSELE